MGLGSHLKKAAKGIAKNAVKQAISPDGILTTVCPQLGVANALVKGVTGGQIDPLAMATGYGKEMIKGQFKGGEITNAAGEVIDIASGAVKMSSGQYGNLKDVLMNDNLSKLSGLANKAATLRNSRAAERAKANANIQQSAAIDELDLSQPNQFSKVFYSIMKNLPTGYNTAKPVLSLSMNTNSLANLTATTAWSQVSLDDFHEWMTDQVKVPLMSTPVSSVSTLVTLINGLLGKLDNDSAMIEFLACFNYAGDEVILPNIEADNPLAHSCLAALTSEQTYKYMNAWINSTYKNNNELDFYREIMSEWLGDEISIAHPMYVDMISSAVISLKGHTIARYLLETCCPYLTNSANTSMIARYNETKLNPYDLLQYCRNIQLNAQINYANSIKPTATAALAAVANYHMYAYLILTLCVKLLSDATMFMKSCMTQAMIDQMSADLIGGVNMQYVFDLCNNDTAWMHVIKAEELASAIVDAQIGYSGITVGEKNDSIEEIEYGIDQITSVVATAEEPDYQTMERYRTRCLEFKGEITDFIDSGEVDTTKANLLYTKIDTLVATINGRMGA